MCDLYFNPYMEKYSYEILLAIQSSTLYKAPFKNIIIHITRHSASVMYKGE